MPIKGDKRKTGKASQTIDTGIPEGWEEQMEAIARAVFTEMMGNAQIGVGATYIPIEGEEIPPEPQVIKKHGKGRKENRKYERLTVSLDSCLFERFKTEMRSRGLSAGKLMDVILWNRYGRPQLSYQGKDQQED
jgi:hypothetical protein